MIDMQIELLKLDERLRRAESAQSSIVIFSYTRPSRDECEKAYWKKTGMRGAVPVGTRIIWYNLMTAQLVTLTTAYDLNNGTASSGEIYRYYTTPPKESRRIISYSRHNKSGSGTVVPNSGGPNSHADYFTDDIMLYDRVMKEAERGLLALEIYKYIEVDFAEAPFWTGAQISFRTTDNILTAQFLTATNSSERLMSVDVIWKTGAGTTTGGMRTSNERLTQPLLAADPGSVLIGGNMLLHAFMFNPYQAFNDGAPAPYLGGWTGVMHVAPQNAAYWLAGIQDMAMSHLGQNFEIVFSSDNGSINVTAEDDGTTVVFGYYGEEV